MSLRRSVGAGILRAALGGTFLSMLAAPVAAAEDPFGAARESTSKVELRPTGGAVDAAARGVCEVRIAEGSPELELSCRHQLGARGEIALVLAGGDPFEPPIWKAPFASPYQGAARLSPDGLAALLAGALAIRIDASAAGGLVVEGPVDTPIFGTDEYCSDTGVCTYENHTRPCIRPNATAKCGSGSSGVGR